MAENNETLENNPPAAARAFDAAGGGGIGIVLVWVVSLFGYDLPPAAAATLTTVIIIFAAALGKRGIRGIAIRIWRGANGNGH